ncbi:MAG: hypothetical protein O3B73_18875 [bacterium]|jgi:outer membrane lipoprotein-sorting protein|nr:hypothetical protein [bacterium]
MQQIMGVVVFFILFSSLAGANDKKLSTGDPKTDAAIVEIQDTRGATVSCQASLQTVYHVLDQQIEETSEAFFKGPGLMFLGVSKDEKWIPAMVSDAGLMWTYDAEEEMVTKFNRGRVYRETGLEIDAYIPDPLRPFRGVIWESIRLSGPEQSDQYIFEAILKPNLLTAQLPVALVSLRLRVSKKDGLLNLSEALDAEKNKIIIRKFDNMRPNVKISDKMFEFVIPAGIHVIDSTSDAIQMLKDLTGSE